MQQSTSSFHDSQETFAQHASKKKKKRKKKIAEINFRHGGFGSAFEPPNENADVAFQRRFKSA